MDEVEVEEQDTSEVVVEFEDEAADREGLAYDVGVGVG